MVNQKKFKCMKQQTSSTRTFYLRSLLMNKWTNATLSHGCLISWCWSYSSIQILSFCQFLPIHHWIRLGEHLNRTPRFFPWTQGIPVSIFQTNPFQFTWGDNQVYTYHYGLFISRCSLLPSGSSPSLPRWHSSCTKDISKVWKHDSPATRKTN